MVIARRSHAKQPQKQQPTCLFFNYILFFLLLCCSFVNCTTLRTCPRPLPPPNAKMIGLTAYRKYPGRDQPGYHGVEEYHEYDEVSFTCNEGYIRTGVNFPYFNKMFMTCGSNGKWFPDTERLGHCVLTKSIAADNCSQTEQLFKCKSDGKCISKEKRCDCNFDCDDASDELDCKVRSKPIFATPGLLSTGIITSPGYPREARYPKDYNCVYHISTLQNHHIQVDFEEFDLPRKENGKCVDFVKIVSIHPQFIHKRKKMTRKKFRTTKKLRTTQTKCGNNMFRRLYSNASHIMINVSLGHVKADHRQHKGFSLSWQVKTRDSFNKALLQELNEQKQIHHPSNEVEKTENNKDDEDDSDTIYKLVLPIALGGLLPMTLVLLCLCHRIVRHHFKMKNSHHNNDNKNGKPTNNDSLRMTLTENNLARFDEHNRTTTCFHPDNNDNDIGNHEDDHREVNVALLTTKNITENARVASQPEGFSDMTNDNNRRYSSCHYDNNSRHSNNYPRESMASYSPKQHSDAPRYIMSYDMPLRTSPSTHTRQSNHSSRHRLSSSACSHSRSNSPRSNTYSRNTSPCFSSHPPQQKQHQPQSGRSKQSRYSCENMPSSCSSQSTNTCSLCHKKRSACNSDRQQRMYLQEQSLPATRPLNINTEPMYQMDYEYGGSDQHSLTPNSNSYMHSPYSSCNVPNMGYTDKDFYNSIQPYPFMAPSCYLQNDPVSYNHNTVPYPLNHSDSDFIAESALMPPLHRVEKHKVIYLEEIAGEEIYGAYSDRTRGGSLICTH